MLKSEKVFSTLRSTLTNVSVKVQLVGIVPYGVGKRYLLGVLVEEDEEDGLSPSFCTYTFYISYTRNGLRPC